MLELLLPFSNSAAALICQSDPSVSSIRLHDDHVAGGDGGGGDGSANGGAKRACGFE